MLIQKTDGTTAYTYGDILPDGAVRINPNGSFYVPPVVPAPVVPAPAVVTPKNPLAEAMAKIMGQFSWLKKK